MTAALDVDLANVLTRARHKIHLVGVAGSGMSGLAALLLELGHEVSGSDKVSTQETDRLQRLGLHFHGQHRSEDARGADLIIFSSAVKIDNPVLAGARDAGKPMLRRAEALAAIMRGKRGILIVGMHGKTTTSAMAAHVLREGGLHPSHYVGAEIPILGTNAHWDPRGEYFVAEGDESDGTLRYFHPEHALILNIEEEHLDFYADLAAIEEVFAQLIEQSSGAVFYNADDENTTRLCRSCPRAISYGFSNNADYRGADIELRDFTSVFCVYHHGQQLGEAVLNVSGRHNVHNAIGVIAVATELGISFGKLPLPLASSVTRVAVLKSNTRASVFYWSTTMRTIPRKFVPRSRQRNRPGANACSRCFNRIAIHERKRCAANSGVPSTMLIALLSRMSMLQARRRFPGSAGKRSRMKSLRMGMAE